MKQLWCQTYYYLLVIISSFLTLFLLRCQRQELNSNPGLWDDEVRVLPPC
jgi:hypothetical protein